MALGKQLAKGKNSVNISTAAVSKTLKDISLTNQCETRKPSKTRPKKVQIWECCQGWGLEKHQLPVVMASQSIEAKGEGDDFFFFFLMGERIVVETNVSALQD